MGSRAFLKIKVFIPIALSFLLLIINPEGLRDSLHRLIIPIEALGGRIRGIGAHLNEAIKDNIRLREENERLKKEITLLLHRYARAEEILIENKRLREILSYKEKTNFSLVVANTLSFSPSFFNSTIIIDRGKEDGIRKGLSVISLFKEREVFIGRIIDVFPRSSLVLLVTDPGFLLPARLKYTREKGLLVGLQVRMELKFVESKTPVMPKEPLLTLADEFTPPDIPIGYVEEISYKKGGLFRKIFVKPYFLSSKLEEVIVLVL